MKVEINSGSRNSCSIDNHYKDIGLSIVIEGSMLLKPYLIMDFPKRLGIHD
jgi:hypothetical protein